MQYPPSARPLQSHELRLARPLCVIRLSASNRKYDRPVAPVSLPPYNPQLAQLVKEPPAGDGWIHEIKLDGYRIGCAIQDGRVTLLSRRNLDWTAEFPMVAAGAKRLGVKAALLDGEVAAVLPDGRTSFHAMQTRVAGTNLAYFVFDILHLDGEDLFGLPVEQRKEHLRDVLGTAPHDSFRYVDHVVGGGAEFFAAATQMRLEGMISKSRTEPYRPGARHRSWQKTKCQLRQEFVIGGWQPSVHGGLGAMILGYYDEKNQLVYAGKVGTGHQRQEKDLLARFARLARAACPFHREPPREVLRDSNWLEPALVAEVGFIEWTGDGLRHPSFQGLREDKDAREVRAERPT
jgi:bifunctional non-homologous end joining protein LigD